MNLNEYVKVKHGNKLAWFLEEIATVSNTQRISKVKANKEYLEGQHDILKRPNFMYNGQVIEPRKIVINLAKQLINWQTAFLLKNNVQVVGEERVADEFNEVSKRAKYNLKNTEILKKLLCFGQCAEYVYMENGRIKSKVLDPAEYTPIFNRYNELIGLVEHYTWNGVSYYVVYDEEKVQEYSNESGKLQLTAQYASLTGLPILYVADDMIGNGEGRSDLEDWKDLLNNMEDLISKYTDSFYTFMNPIPIVIGQELKGEMSKEVVGQGLKLDDGADFKYATNKLDSNTFNSLYKTLNQTLLDVSATPSVALGKSEISNVSEQTIKLMFSLAEVKADINEKHMKRGLYERYEKIRTLLEYRGFAMSDTEFYSIDFVFNYNIPMNDKEIIDNMRTLREMNGISIESLLEKNPYVEDVQMEKQRLIQEGILESGKVD